jgi:thioredoxin reductase (NADPH)
MKTAKLVVIGAGPAGIAVGVEAARAGLDKVVILEKAAHPCDTIVNLYRRGKRVDAVYRQVALAPRGVLNFTEHSRESFLAWVDEVIAEYHLDIRYGREVFELERQDGRFLVRGGEVEIIAWVVVVAIGVFGKPVKPSYAIPAEVKTRVHFSLSEPPPSGRRLLVVGGGDSAAEAACFLSRDNKVTLSYRRREFFRINAPNLCTLNRCCTFDNLVTELGVDITGLAADGERIEVSYADGRKISYDEVFYFLGGSTPRAFLEKAGIAYSGNRPAVDAHGESNVPGLFLAGDLVAAKGAIMAAFNSGAAIIARLRETSPEIF